MMDSLCKAHTIVIAATQEANEATHEGCSETPLVPQVQPRLADSPSLEILLFALSHGLALLLDVELEALFDALPASSPASSPASERGDEATGENENHQHPMCTD